MAGTIVVGTIQSESNGDIDLAPNGTGVVEVRGNDNAGSIKLNCENNSHGVTIKSPAHSANASYTLTLPTSNGNSNEVLQTDGDGVLSWTTAGDASVANENTWTSGQRGEVTNLDSASNVLAIDFDASNNFHITTTEDITDINYTDLNQNMVGQSGSIFFTFGGAHTIGGWDAETRWSGGDGSGGGAPTFTATNGKVDRVDYLIVTDRDTPTQRSHVRVHMVATLNMTN